MDARFNYMGNAVAAKFAQYLLSAGQVVTGSSLPVATQHLVEIRASQINGCAYAWNRLNVITQQPAGDYQPGQWG